MAKRPIGTIKPQPQSSPDPDFIQPQSTPEHPGTEVDDKWVEYMQNAQREFDLKQQLEKDEALEQGMGKDNWAGARMSQTQGTKDAKEEVEERKLSALSEARKGDGAKLDGSPLSKDDLPLAMTSPLGAGPGGTDNIGEPDTTTSRLAAEIHAAAEETRSKATGYKSQAAIVTRQTAKTASMQRQAAEAMEQGGVAQARRHMAGLAAAYDQADLELASLRVDPRRWEESTPVLAQVFMALASSAFSFFSGGQGPNPVAALIDRAITRDVEAQKTNIELAIKRGEGAIDKNMTLFKAESTLTAAIWDRALNTWSSMIKEGTLDAGAFDMMGTHKELMAAAEQAHANHYDANVLSWNKQRQAQAVLGGKSLSKVDAKAHQIVSGTPLFVQSLGELMNLWSGSAESGIGALDAVSSVIPGTVENQYSRLMDNAALFEGAALQGKQLNEMELKAVKKGYPGHLDDRQTAKVFFGRKIDMMKKNLEGILQSNTGHADVRAAQQAYQQVLQFEQSFNEKIKALGWEK